jgi:hypothetical protein
VIARKLRRDAMEVSRKGFASADVWHPFDGLGIGTLIRDVALPGCAAGKWIADILGCWVA